MGLSGGREYRAQVTAVNQAGESEPSTLEERFTPVDIIELPEIELDATC